MCGLLRNCYLLSSASTLVLNFSINLSPGTNIGYQQNCTVNLEKNSILTNAGASLVA